MSENPFKLKVGSKISRKRPHLEPHFQFINTKRLGTRRDGMY